MCSFFQQVTYVFNSKTAGQPRLQLPLKSVLVPVGSSGNKTTITLGTSPSQVVANSTASLKTVTMPTPSGVNIQSFPNVENIMNGSNCQP